MKMTSNGRWSQNIKSWISLQPLIGSASNLKLKETVSLEYYIYEHFSENFILKVSKKGWIYITLCVIFSCGATQ